MIPCFNVKFGISMFVREFSYDFLYASVAPFAVIHYIIDLLVAFSISIIVAIDTVKINVNSKTITIRLFLIAFTFRNCQPLSIYMFLI